MEVLGLGLQALGSAIAAVAGWAGFTAVAGIAAVTLLVYTEKATLDDIKKFLKRDRRF
jgi:hypothetical protein